MIALGLVLVGSAASYLALVWGSFLSLNYEAIVAFLIIWCLTLIVLICLTRRRSPTIWRTLVVFCGVLLGYVIAWILLWRNGDQSTTIAVLGVFYSFSSSGTVYIDKFRWIEDKIREVKGKIQNPGQGAMDQAISLLFDICKFYFSQVITVATALAVVLGVGFTIVWTSDPLNLFSGQRVNLADAESILRLRKSVSFVFLVALFSIYVMLTYGFLIPLHDHMKRILELSRK